MDQFVIRLDLSKYFVGDKAKVIVLCDTKWKNVQKLKDHVETIFQLEDVQFKTVDGYWIPLQESIELFRFIDLVKVYGGPTNGTQTGTSKSKNKFVEVMVDPSLIDPVEVNGTPKIEAQTENSKPKNDTVEGTLAPYIYIKRKLNEMEKSFFSSTPNIQKKFKKKDGIAIKETNPPNDIRVLDNCFNITSSNLSNCDGKSVPSTTEAASRKGNKQLVQSVEELKYYNQCLIPSPNQNGNPLKKKRRKRSKRNISVDENIINIEERGKISETLHENVINNKESDTDASNPEAFSFPFSENSHTLSNMNKSSNNGEMDNKVNEGKAKNDVFITRVSNSEKFVECNKSGELDNDANQMKPNISQNCSQIQIESNENNENTNNGIHMQPNNETSVKKRRRRMRNRKKRTYNDDIGSTNLLGSNDEKFSDSYKSNNSEPPSPLEKSPTDCNTISPRIPLLNDQNINEKENEASLNAATIFTNSTIKDLTCNKKSLEADKSSIEQNSLENIGISLRGEESPNKSKTLTDLKKSQVCNNLWVDDFSKHRMCDTEGDCTNMSGEKTGPQNSPKHPNNSCQNCINSDEQASKIDYSLSLNNSQRSNLSVEKNILNIQDSQNNIADSSACQESLTDSFSYRKNARSTINEENSYIEDDSCSVIAIDTSEDDSHISSFHKDTKDTDDTRNVSATFNNTGTSNNHKMTISEMLPLAKELADLPNVGNIVIFKLQVLKYGKITGTTAYMAGKCEYVNKRSKTIKIYLTDGENETSKISDAYFCNLDDTKDKRNLSVKFSDMIEPKIYISIN